MSVLTISPLIDSFNIPASLVELKEGWCRDASNLQDIKVDPNYKYYKCMKINCFLANRINPVKNLMFLFFVIEL